MNRESPEGNHSWQECRATVLRQGLPHARTDWCVRWARRFTRSGLGVPLGELSRPASGCLHQTIRDGHSNRLALSTAKGLERQRIRASAQHDTMGSQTTTCTTGVWFD